MDPVEIFATGGASGLAGLVIYLVFRFLQSRHHLVSKCDKDGVTVIADASTPKNITLEVEDAGTTTKQEDHDRSSDRANQNVRRVSQGGSTGGERLAIRARRQSDSSTGSRGRSGSGNVKLGADPSSLREGTGTGAGGRETPGGGKEDEEGVPGSKGGEVVSGV